MPKSLRCPACDCALPLPAVPGPMACDGCHHPFDATHVRYVPASWPRRLLGWLLLAASAYLFVLVVPAFLAIVMEAPAAERGEAVVFSILTFLQFSVRPTIPFFLGLYLLRGRIVGVPTMGTEKPITPPDRPV